MDFDRGGEDGEGFCALRYYYNGERMGQGKEKAKAYLKENPSVFAKIQGELRTKLFGESSEPAVAAAPNT
ncbi:hypothetical protein CYMTET_45998 [Cymbomonas tetramitiformis]|uniref:RecA-like C-terminal domain-containing protein n=1 Tax=Cymbomonas tetramitiformis TaxID=36881 RepID=A0AAE0BY93_9CHLO|nr:hypothetical protein CYMTET_45998 [Cymbomonas tetramitiformis]